MSDAEQNDVMFEPIWSTKQSSEFRCECYFLSQLSIIRRPINKEFAILCVEGTYYSMCRHHQKHVSEPRPREMK